MKVADLKIGLLQYFVGQETLYAVLINQEGQARKFRLISCEKVFPLIDTLFEAMEGNYPPQKVSSVFQKFSVEWGKHLLPPSSYLKAFDVLVIIPHHFLHGIPFHAIWLEDTKLFLGVSHGVTYCSSGTLFTRCVDRNSVRKGNLALWEFALDKDTPIVGPEPPRKCLSVGVDVKFDKTNKYAELANTFANYFPEVLFQSPGRVNVKSRILATRWELEPDRKIEAICIVSHGYLDPIVADNSGLLLEGERGGILERPISLHRGSMYLFRDMPFRYLPVEITPRADCVAELMTVSELKVDCYTETQLVALFGCSTGAGKVLAGDDFGSLAYQWLKIGSASVLANFWELDLNVATRWLPIFLDNWIQKRQPKAIAWREALKAILTENPELSIEEWGVIALLGDWL